MDLKTIMQQKNFVIVGDTINPDKYAYKIKHAMIDNGYRVECVGKELVSINDVHEDIDIIDLFIHPAKGINLLKECQKSFKCIVIQPGAESSEIIAYLNENKLPYVEACLLGGLSLYRKENL